VTDTGVTVSAGGITVTGNSTITGTLGGITALTIGGALAGATTGAFSGLITSTATTGMIASATATATPSAYSATQSTLFASTVSGATLMGYGTTGDVTLKNRAGTDVIVVTSNTTGVTMAGALAITGALSGVTTLATSSTINSQTISSAANFTGTVTVATSVLPDADGGAVLGAAGSGWSSLFLSEGAVINWDSSDLTLTQTGNVLALAGGTLDMGNNAISNIGAAGTDFSATGGLTLADALVVTAGGATISAGVVTVGVSTDAQVIVDQSTGDGEILTLRSATDIAHGMTTQTATASYGTFAKNIALEGGLYINGYTEGQQALRLQGNATTNDTTKTTGGVGHILLDTFKKSGTSVGANDANSNLVVIRTNGTTRFIFDEEGSGHADVEWVAFDSYDDLALVTEVEQVLLSREAMLDGSGAMTRRRKQLEQTGIIGKGSWHLENGRPRAMVNTTRLAMLHHGALIQVGDRFTQAEARLEALERRFDLALGAARG
jgi:hypothetical protein